ncbi:MAG: hypothetical protein QOJ22_7 [Thermoleophilaceae bacterium]|nr:hypothetical protein [Thermoleophilaceae bacterium]
MSNLAELIAAVGPDLAAHANPQAGPGRFDSLGDDARAFVLEAVYEAYLLHYGEPRAFVGMDPDLRLLAGDTLYAEGLARLADLGDMEAVTELADLISLCAWAEAAGRRDLVDRLWDASSRRLLGAGGMGARAEVAADLARARP